MTWFAAFGLIIFGAAFGIFFVLLFLGAHQDDDQ